MTFKKIEGRNTLAPQIYEQLRLAILRGTLPPGTRLVETKLAEDLGVSRTPVREAVSRLLAQGFLREEGNARMVADMAAELTEIFGIRQVLEGYACRQAVENATQDELAVIEAVCESSLAAVDSTSVGERAAFNNIFHSAIAKASHSDRLIRIISDFYEYAITEEMLPFYNRQKTHDHVEQHVAILEALKARDADAAEAAMKHHIATVGEAIVEMVNTVRHDEDTLQAASDSGPGDRQAAEDKVTARLADILRMQG